MTRKQKREVARWRFGRTQTNQQERTEIERAKNLGLTDLYMQKQGHARMVEKRDRAAKGPQARR